MAENRYITIDKTILAEGCAYDFSIYYGLENNTKVKELKPKGVLIDDSDLLYVQTDKKFFVKDQEHHAYEDFYKNHLQITRETK